MKSSTVIFSATLFLLGFMLFFSCKKKTTDFDMYYDYFPINQGHYVVYQVREIYTDVQVNQKDTFDYYLKTVLEDTTLDNSGRVARKYVRYISSNSTGPWTAKDVWTCIIQNGKAELVEENNRVIKLVFAPSEDDNWDMNVYNTLGEMECYYSSIHKPYSILGSTFNETVTVEQEDFTSYIDYRRKYEVYARGVGLAHKFYKDLKIIGGNVNNIKSGKELEMKLVSYGN